jgi:hypothetical protein
MSMLLIALLQAASPAPADAPADAAPPTRFSILVPVADEPCRPRAPKDADVVVCGDALKSQRLPFPNEPDPNHGRPSNPDMTGARALELQNTPCAAQAGGCGGAGIPILGMALWAGKKLIDAVGDAAKSRPDKSKRVAIPLDDPVPVGATPTP